MVTIQIKEPTASNGDLQWYSIHGLGVETEGKQHGDAENLLEGEKNDDFDDDDWSLHIKTTSTFYLTVGASHHGWYYVTMRMTRTEGTGGNTAKNEFNNDGNPSA